MTQINSIGVQANRLMDALGLPDSIGDAVGAVIDLGRGDKAGFIRNMNDLSDDVNKFIFERFNGRKILKSAAKKASVRKKKTKGIRRALTAAKPLLKRLAKTGKLGLFSPQVLLSTAVLSVLIGAVKQAKQGGAAPAAPSQPQVRNQLPIQVQTPVQNLGPLQTGSLEERVMLALSTGIKDNATELDKLMGDIQNIGNKPNMTDKDKNDLQLLQVKLQITMNRRNEMVNTLSNIMKTLHEMNMSSVRNIRM
ncbi:MAG TPA: hypothetical protein VII00_05105 [bacterium]